jgi:hypothetical protein
MQRTVSTSLAPRSLLHTQTQCSALKFQEKFKALFTQYFLGLGSTSDLFPHDAPLLSSNKSSQRKRAVQVREEDDDGGIDGRGRRPSACLLLLLLHSLQSLMRLVRPALHLPSPPAPASAFRICRPWPHRRIQFNSPAGCGLLHPHSPARQAHTKRGTRTLLLPQPCSQPYYSIWNGM